MEFIKNHFYPGKLLHAGDFIREQEYGNSKLEFLNRKFHGYGIIEGLQLFSDREGAVCLKAGSAIDGWGRLIVVPETVKLDRKNIEGTTAGEFVLGIHYAEKAVGKERNLLKRDEEYQAARIAETFALKAHLREELQELQKARASLTLTEERLLYEDGAIRLSLRVPKLVPSDSIFRISIQVCSLTGERTEVKWSGICKLQGASFLETGQNTKLLAGSETMLSGMFCRDWQLCTEEARQLPILIELENLEISLDNAIVKAENTQFYVQTTTEYGDAVQRSLWDNEEAGKQELALSEGGWEEWVPLALLRQEGNSQEDCVSLQILDDKKVRPLAVRPEQERLIRQVREESGIVDIGWRGLLKQLCPPPSEGRPPYRPEKHSPYQPEGHLPRRPEERPPYPPGHRSANLCIHQGVAVISVPRNYRRKQVLLSEEIKHGFPKRKVLIFCGRLYEEHNAFFWEKIQDRHFIISGQDDLFEDQNRSGWYIENQAVRQDIEAGSFRIAVTLRRGRNRKGDREVAVSWMAVQSG